MTPSTINSTLDQTTATRLAHAGVLTFGDDGVLFVADTVNGAVFAYETGAQPLVPSAPTDEPLHVERVDETIASALGVSPAAVQVNGLAVHPLTGEIHVSVSYIRADTALPAIVVFSRAGHIRILDLDTLSSSRHIIDTAPDQDAHFEIIGHWPVPSRQAYEAKARTPMRTLTIVDMKYHRGELFIAGIGNEEFSSTLRHVAYPFTGASSETKVRMYHVAHGQYETRAPVRTMAFADIDGQDTLIAAYTCSPIVLLPVDRLTDGAKVTGTTIGDMGNGQPLCMVPVTINGEDHLFVTNAGHGPRMVPISGFQQAASYTPDSFGGQRHSDLSPEYPLGPVGKEVMFIGTSLWADRLDEGHLVSLTRDATSGLLLLEALPISPLPAKLTSIWSEYDFPGAGTDQPAEG